MERLKFCKEARKLMKTAKHHAKHAHFSFNNTEMQTLWHFIKYRRTLEELKTHLDDPEMLEKVDYLLSLELDWEIYDGIKHVISTYERRTGTVKEIHKWKYPEYDSLRNMFLENNLKREPYKVLIGNKVVTYTSEGIQEYMDYLKAKQEG